MEMNKGRTLWETYRNSMIPIEIPWRVYGNRSHRLICENYGATTWNEDDIDKMLVVKVTPKKRYVRVVVED